MRSELSVRRSRRVLKRPEAFERLVLRGRGGRSDGFDSELYSSVESCVRQRKMLGMLEGGSEKVRLTDEVVGRRKTGAADDHVRLDCFAVGEKELPPIRREFDG